MNRAASDNTRLMLAAGLAFAVLEICKQIYLTTTVFPGAYPVWYFPFQLCSMPIYLCLLYRWFPPKLQTATETFLADYGFLGGALSLIVRDGFTFPEHPLLTAHGYVWHIGMCLLAVLLWRRATPEQCSARGFLRTLPLFAVLAVMAEMINVVLHPYGDCDMFYISPYHLSVQPVFGSIDAAIGRPAGIAVYLLAVILGAAMVHWAADHAHGIATISGNRETRSHGKS